MLGRQARAVLEGQYLTAGLGPGGELLPSILVAALGGAGVETHERSVVLDEG